MKKILIILFLFITPALFSQTKYYIYFKDKGNSPAKILNTAAAQKIEALKLLSKRSIERREKVMPANHLITFEDLPLDRNYVEQVIKLGVKIENKLKWFNAVTAYLTDKQKTEIASLPFVKKISPVRVFMIDRKVETLRNRMEKTSVFPVEADYGNSYAQEKLSDIPIVHQKGITGDGVLIGILDDGFMWKQHESLVTRKVLAEYNFVFHTESTAPQPGDATDSGIHGTFVFSVIGGYKDSSIIGVAYNATYVLAKTEDDRSEKHIEEDNYAAALQWMDSIGVDMTTSSLGYNIFDTGTSYTYADMNGNTAIVTKAANLAFQRGILVLNAAGNEGDTNWKYIIAPADGFNVIAVGAVNNNNQVAFFSSIGPTSDGRIKPDLVAQGVNDFGASVPGFSSYSFGDGTSFATPIASGVAALLLSAYPYLTNVQARFILLHTAGNFSTPNNDRGYGLVSAEHALSYPNIFYDSTNNLFKVNKIFFAQHGVVTSTAKFHYTLDGKTFTTSNLNYDGKLIYSTNLPMMPDSQTISFYYTYQDSTGSNFREPSTDYFHLKYGQKNIVTVVSPLSKLAENVLGQNYPNPFNASTTIEFYSKDSSPARLVIMNTIGQVVKVLFNGTANIGQNTIRWNGKNNKGIQCASGVYYYLLHLAGKNYGEKMIMLK